MKVIYLMSDSFRRDHLGAYGNKWIHTPNLDKLAGTSAVFDNAYVGSWPTIPNRRDTLLGHGDRGLPFNRWKGLELDEITFPARLAEKRIPSMLITDTQNNVTKSHNLYKDFTAWTVNRGQEGDSHWMDDTVPHSFPVPKHLIRYAPEMWNRVQMNRAHRRVETDWFAPGTYTLAMKWLQQNYRRKDFFLWVDTFDPHEPWDPPQYYVDLYDPGYKGRLFEAPTYGLRKKMGITDRELKQIRARYAGEVTMVDHWVGELLGMLERLGILDETMVVFTSDHGIYLDTTGDNGLICKPINIGADGMNMSAGRPMKEPIMYYPLLENNARVPLMIKLPGMRRAKRIREIAQPWDMTATILDQFRMKKPKEFIGNSLLPLIRGKGGRTRDVAIMGVNVLTQGAAQAMTPRWLYTAWQEKRSPVLFDLKNDPKAVRNLVKKRPEVVRRLRKEILRFMERQNIDGEIVDRHRWYD